MKTIDLASQNALAIREAILDHGISANGKSAPSTKEQWSIHARQVNDKGEVQPGALLGATNLTRVAGQWRPGVHGRGSGRLGEASTLLARVR